MQINKNLTILLQEILRILQENFKKIITFAHLPDIFKTRN